MLQERTGWSGRTGGRGRCVDRDARRCGLVHLYAAKSLEIPAVNARRDLDPTGCGDAYRAGFVFGIEPRLSWDDTGRLALLMGHERLHTRDAESPVHPESLLRSLSRLSSYALAYRLALSCSFLFVAGRSRHSAQSDAGNGEIRWSDLHRASYRSRSTARGPSIPSGTNRARPPGLSWMPSAD